MDQPQSTVGAALEFCDFRRSSQKAFSNLSVQCSVAQWVWKKLHESPDYYTKYPVYRTAEEPLLYPWN